MIEKIVIHRLKVNAIIGCFEFERVKKQPLIVSVEIELKAGETDDNIAATLNYDDIATLILAMANATDYQLIESFARDLFSQIKKKPLVGALAVKIEKPNAIPNAEYAGFEIKG